jgi:FtsH-binding integral membrane protein
MAVAAVAAGTLFAVRPPEAYGICMACHGRDLVNSVVNGLLGTDLVVAPAALVFPLLTTVGVIVGAWIAAVVSGEFRFRRAKAPLKAFVNGMLVMNFALLAAGCSTRLALRSAAGDILGAIGFAAMIGGVVLATVWMRRRARR